MTSFEELPAITAIAPWFGGKRTLASEIVKAIGPHSCYWEPFCGSMAVLISKPIVSMETVNDLHGDLINLARVIRDPSLGPILYRRLRRTLASKFLMEDSVARWKETEHRPIGEPPCVDRAYDYFLCSWLGRNGVSGTASCNQGFSRRFTKNGGHSAKRWCSAIDSIPAWRRRLREVTILNQCGIELCEKIEDADNVAIYLDPPYLVKGAKYLHDFSASDHDRLAIALRRFSRTRIILSYYDDPRLEALYPGFHFRRLEATKALVNQGMRDAKGKTPAPEVLISNLPFLSEARSTTKFFD